MLISQPFPLAHKLLYAFTMPKVMLASQVDRYDRTSDQMSDRRLRTSSNQRKKKKSKMAEKLDSENILLITDSYKVRRPSLRQNLVIYLIFYL